MARQAIPARKDNSSAKKRDQKAAPREAGRGGRQRYFILRLVPHLHKALPEQLLEMERLKRCPDWAWFLAQPRDVRAAASCARAADTIASLPLSGHSEV